MCPKVSVLILNWNRKLETCSCIDSIFGQTYKNVEIVIVDNGSTDGSQNYIKNKYGDCLKYIVLDKNYGCPAGRNIGLNYCEGEFVFFCDNDGMLHHMAIENSVKVILSSHKIAIVTGVVTEFNCLNEIDLNFPVEDNSSFYSFNFLGGVCLLNLNAIENNVIFPESYVYGGEEEYLSYRLIDRGYTIIKSCNVILFHRKSLLGRDANLEFFNKWTNRFLNAYQLFPFEFLFLYFVYFNVVYAHRALTLNCFIDYSKSSFLMYKKIKHLDRCPVKRWTFYKIQFSKFI